MVANTGLAGGQHHPMPMFLQGSLRKAVGMLGNTVADSAKIQAYLAGSARVAEDDVGGKYWEPIFTWTQRYNGCKVFPVGALADDVQEQETLWTYSEDAVRKAVRDEQHGEREKS